MKRFIRFFVILFTISIALQSCSKPGDLTDRETFIRFTIDQTEYYFENVTTSQYSDKSSSNGTARIYPEDTPITLYIPMDVTKGAHEVEEAGKPTEYKVAFDTGFSGNNPDFAHEGRIIIFNVSEEYVEGTFIAHVTSSVSKEEVTLADGRFRAYLN